MTSVANILALDLSTKGARAVFGTDANGVEFGALVVSADSPQYRAEQNRQRTESINFRASRGGKGLDIENNAADRAVFDQRFELAQTDNACAITVGWFGFTDGDKPAKYDPAAMRTMYEKFPSWRNKAMKVCEGDQSAFLQS